MAASLAALCIDNTQATISGGECPKVINTVTDFDSYQYLGRWYDVASDFFFSGPCGTATYQLKENGNIQVKNRGWFWWFFFSFYTVLGEATCSETDLGKCWVNFGTGKTDLNRPASYNVMYTDYTNVALVYSCRPNIFGKEESGWILTRDWNITEDQIKAYETQFMTLMPTFKGSLSRHVQGTNRAPDCTYLPEIYAD